MREISLSIKVCIKRDIVADAVMSAISKLKGRPLNTTDKSLIVTLIEEAFSNNQEFESYVVEITGK